MSLLADHSYDKDETDKHNNDDSRKSGVAAAAAPSLLTLFNPPPLSSSVSIESQNGEASDLKTRNGRQSLDLATETAVPHSAAEKKLSALFQPPPLMTNVSSSTLLPPEENTISSSTKPQTPQLYDNTSSLLSEQPLFKSFENRKRERTDELSRRRDISLPASKTSTKLPSASLSSALAQQESHVLPAALSRSRSEPTSSGKTTESTNRSANSNSERTPLLSASLTSSEVNSEEIRFFSQSSSFQGALDESFLAQKNNLFLPKSSYAKGKPFSTLSAIDEMLVDVNTGVPVSHLPKPVKQTLQQQMSFVLKYSCSELLKSGTWIGAFMYLLYQIVFCLTMGSAITRPHGTSSMLGVMTKMAAGGIVFSAPVYWLALSDDIPSLYPTVDLFTAPFLANIAALVDDTLYNDSHVQPQDNDVIFLGTFTVLVCIAFFGSGTLLLLSNVFRLANLGAFLPSAVLSGFFAAVGVLTWTLSFKVDSNGKSVGSVLSSGDLSLMCNCLLHHLPSVIVASFMRYLGPKHPFWVIALIFVTISIFYLWMLVFNVSMEEMIERGWFWSKNDFSSIQSAVPVGFAAWRPPAPMGWINSLLRGQVHWEAVKNGMPTTLALAFLYMIRCSLHGAALKKNVPNLQRTVKVVESQHETVDSNSCNESFTRKTEHRREFSEQLDQTFIFQPQCVDKVVAPAVSALKMETQSAKPTHHDLKHIMHQYSLSQYICAIGGSFGITPSVAASSTMYTLGAENVAPQIGSVIFLFLFYLTNFELVSYIPKPAFSSLLVLAFIDMTANWFIKSYYKTREKVEWLVVPLIVILAFTVGLLSAVFLGIGLSTFVFVASFYRSGVVKYSATGITIRSTIERPLDRAKWLDQHGEYIQILVLQNYLFFGNASSILVYIQTMFEGAADDTYFNGLPPFPKIIILDFALVSGMDGSAVEVIGDILSVCDNQSCKLFFSGLSQPMRQTLLLGGIKLSTDKDRKQRKLRLFGNLDSAIGKAEDLLLSENAFVCDTYHTQNGFCLCLHLIDEQHGTNYEKELTELAQYTKVVEMKPEEILYEDQELDRGLFFIEEGLMKIERHASYTLSRVGTGSTFRGANNDTGSLNAPKARSGMLAREKVGNSDPAMQTFRVARIGPGWVLGSIEKMSGMATPGLTIAVSHCRLHYISFKKVEELEQVNPVLVLKLYKLLSFLMAKRQEITIGHLATLHSIMCSPAQKKPLSRLGAQAFSNKTN